MCGNGTQVGQGRLKLGQGHTSHHDITIAILKTNSPAFIALDITTYANQNSYLNADFNLVDFALAISCQISAAK